MKKRTFDEAYADGLKALPNALRIIGKRLESDDMVETTVLNQAADVIEQLRAGHERKSTGKGKK